MGKLALFALAFVAIAFSAVSAYTTTIVTRSISNRGTVMDGISNRGTVMDSISNGYPTKYDGVSNGYPTKYDGVSNRGTVMDGISNRGTVMDGISNGYPTKYDGISNGYPTKYDGVANHHGCLDGVSNYLGCIRDGLSNPQEQCRIGQLYDCKMHLTQGIIFDKMAVRPFQQHPLQQCCSQLLKQVNEQCQCDAIQQVFNEAVQPQGGVGSVGRMQKMMFRRLTNYPTTASCKSRNAHS